ncbi:MAG: ATP-binding protein [bacterium]|nr:ATP-binding protein [bacterium]
MSLRRRLLASYLALVLFAGGSLVLVLSWSLRRQAMADLVDRYTSEAELIARLVAPDVARQGDLVSIHQVAAERDTRITVIAADGTVLADSEQDPAGMDPHGDRPEVRQARERGKGHAVRHSRTLGLDMLYVAVPVTHAGEMVGVTRVAVPLAAVNASLRRLTLVVLACLAPSVLLAAGISVRMAGSIAGPVEALTQTARRLAQGDLQARAPLTSDDELDITAATLNDMAESLHRHMETTAADKRRLEVVLEAMTSAVLFLDEAGRVQLANPAAVSYLGVDLGDLTGKNHWQVMRDYQLASLVEQSLETGTVRRQEVKLAFPRELVLDVSVIPLSGTPGGVLVVTYDLTGLRRLERLRSEFVANVSHELKTPVTAVQGFAETLMATKCANDADVREFAGIIHSEASRLAGLIEDLLELSRLESGAAKPVSERLDLTRLAAQAVERLLPSAGSRRMSLAGPGGVPVTVHGDGRQLEQAAVNLIDNAIKYGRPGGTVEVTVTTEGDSALLRVADDGPGIAREDLPRVFERFYRADKARSSRQPGAGLGLAIVKHVAGAHGGEASVSSEPGRTVFTLRLPLS